MNRFREALLLAFAASSLLQCTPSSADLVIRIESPTTEYEEPAIFELWVIFRNGGDTPIIVLPQRLRRTYVSLGDGDAAYSPYPGPPIAPWKDAFLLRPGQSHRMRLLGMRDGDGVWSLEPGRYDLSVRLIVTSEAIEASRAQVAHLGAAIWQGDIRSPSVRVTFSAAPAA
jgi:hypothetical protein